MTEFTAYKVLHGLGALLPTEQITILKVNMRIRDLPVTFFFLTDEREAKCRGRKHVSVSF